MAEIYLAAPGDGTSDQRVAIKVIHQQNASDPDFVRMLLDEARLAVQLDHPNIVKTYDLGKEKEQYYIVMEFIDGADLFKVQQRGAVRRQAFPLALCAYVTREVTRGLEFAHRLKDAEGRPLYIVHRDISPQNVLCSFDGEVKITDFGIAKAAHRSEQTQAGIIKGKYYYMSPEQAMGRLIDARTDVFAAGILLYEMLVGEMLYYHDDLDKLLAMVRKADIVPPSKRRRDVPPVLDAICMQALRKKSDERFQSAADYGAALDEFLRDFAPDYGAADLGAFVTRMMDGPKERKPRRESLSLTPIAAASSGDEHSPTMGLSHDQLERLGIRDENSLIFAPLDKLEALLNAEKEANRGAQAGRANQAAGVARVGLSGGTDSNILTRRRVLDKKMEIDPALLEQTSPDGDHSAATPKREVLVPGAKGRGGDWSDESTNPAWNEARAGGKGPQRSPLVSVGSSSDDVQDRPTVSTEAAPVLVGFGALGDEAHESPTAPRPAEAARLARVSMEIPALEIRAAKAAYESESRRPTRPQRPPPNRPSEAARPLVFELMPQPAPVDLVISDDGFAQVAPEPSAAAVEPSVELTQSDVDFAALPSPPGGKSASLDAISRESTHHDDVPMAPVAGPVAEALISSSQPSLLGGSSSSAGLPVQPVSSRSRAGYILAGLGAAAISAVVTWQLTGGARSLGSRDDGGPTDGGLQLILYDAPAVEPPPAPLSEPGPIAPPSKSSLPATTPNGGPAPSAAPTGAPTSEARGTISLTSTPVGAEVYLNKKLLGTTPLELTDQPLDSDVRVELLLDGYQKTKKHIKWKGKSSLTVNVKLKAVGDAAEGTAADSAAEPPSK